MWPRHWTAHRLHRWSGLAAGVWLAVLGATGFVLDHRDWAWLWQSGVSPAWVPARIADRAALGHVRLYRILDAKRRLAGGPAGLWRSEDAGDHWQRVRAPRGERLPPVYQLLRTADGWLLATADGIWKLPAGVNEARPWALKGQAVTAIAPRDAQRLWAVVGRSAVVSVDRRTAAPRSVNLPAVPAATLPPTVDLSRWVHDLHFGRGLFVAPWSLLWSDATAIGWVVLPLGGFLYWWLPRRFRARRRAGQPVSGTRRRRWMRWLYRLHAPTVGLLVLVPLLYLSVTGILLDHATALRPWMKATALSRAALPPVYNLSSWQGEIRAIVGWPDHPDRLSLGTRLGLFTVEDGDIRREPLAGGQAVFVWMARQDEGVLALGGMGGPNHVWADGRWRPQPSGAHMPSDMTRDEQGRLLWKTRSGLRLRTPTGYRTLATPVPELGYVPWYHVLDGLHSGMLIHPQWKWINDLVALLAVLLAATGVWRWWRVKWL